MAMRKASHRILPAIIAVAMSCWSAASPTAGAALQERAQIKIQNFMFSPETITITAGSAVTWVNKDEEPHTVVSDTGLFRSGGVDTNETFVYTFDKPGSYPYFCSLHPKMTGKVVVQ